MPRRNVPGTHKQPKSRSESDSKDGWVKQGKVWRSSKAQEAVRSDAVRFSEDDLLRAYALAKSGPGGYQSFGDIPAHRLGRSLRTQLYQLANRLPEDERHNLASRIKSAATTVTASLATGFGEGTFRSCVTRALESRGALLSLQDHLRHLCDQRLLSDEDHQRMKLEVDQVVAAVNDYLGRLAKERDKFQAKPSSKRDP